MNEGSTSKFSGTALFDDGTIAVLSGSNLSWSVLSGPIVSINADGVATTDLVYADTAATARGSYRAAAGTLTLTVLDSNPDNFGSYAGDGLPDSWQVQYFGQNNSEAGPTVDADGTGQNNLFKYVAAWTQPIPPLCSCCRFKTCSVSPTRRI